MTVTVSATAPLVAMIRSVRVPGPPYVCAVTRPVAFTRAMLVSVELQVSGRPVKKSPAASRGTASSCSVLLGRTSPPSGVMVTFATVSGRTSTDAVSASVPVATITEAVRMSEPT